MSIMFMCVHVYTYTGVPLWLNGLKISVVTAAAQVAALARVQSLAPELPQIMSMAKKKKNGNKETYIDIYDQSLLFSEFTFANSPAH